MSPISILLIGLAMSTDAFAAAVGKGAAMQRPRFSQALRAGIIFGVIEGLTPLIGWLLGMAASRYIAAWDHWIAFTVLCLLGAHMIYASFQQEKESDEPAARHGFWGLATTGFATSIDAMAIGVTLAFLDANILVVASVIALTTFTLVTIGIMLGRVLGILVGKRAETVGGIILILIGAAILYEHLTGLA
ncbi:MAG: manganese efflux pump MntP family protein [Xanthomonadaceae bacterium]|jgi:putative Mn2+ efflux pump MntP|nr:manganese efflux pump MntP family protein [Xanthomonadaceae bacterium]